MARSVNSVTLVGNLGRDAETRFTPQGVSVSSFSIATSRRWKDSATGEWKEQAEFTNVVLWRQDALAQYLTKGKQVYVQGRLQTRSYDDKEGNKRYVTEVVAEEVILLGGGKEPELRQSDRKPNPYPPAAGAQDSAGIDDELPF